MFCASARTFTYRNNNGTFVDATAASSYKGELSRDIEIVDFNGDGRKDLLIVQMRRSDDLAERPGRPASSPSDVRAISGQAATSRSGT